MSQRYTIESLTIEGDSAATISVEQYPVAVLAAPTRPLDAKGEGRIRSYLDDGGSLLVLLDRNQLNPQAPIASSMATGVEPLLAERGINIPDGTVFDLRSSERISLGQQGIFNVVRPYPFWPITSRASDHMVVRELNNLTLGWASPLVTPPNGKRVEFA